MNGFEEFECKTVLVVRKTQIEDICIKLSVLQMRVSAGADTNYWKLGSLYLRLNMVLYILQ